MSGSEALERYYHPEWWEYFIGFEYQQRTPRGWVDCVFTWKDQPTFRGDHIGKELCRVKYLDRKDVLDCGWEEVGEKFKYQAQENITYYMEFLEEGIALYRYNTTFKKHRVSVMYYNLKNKSEFKRLTKNLIDEIRTFPFERKSYLRPSRVEW